MASPKRSSSLRFQPNDLPHRPGGGRTTAAAYAYVCSSLTKIGIRSDPDFDRSIQDAFGRYLAQIHRRVDDVEVPHEGLVGTVRLSDDELDHLLAVDVDALRLQSDADLSIIVFVLRCRFANVVR